MSQSHRLALAFALSQIAAGCSPAAQDAAPAGSTAATTAQPTGSGARGASPQGGTTSTGTATAATSTATASAAPAPGAPDVLATSAGEVKITPVYHGTVMLEHAGKVIIVDPWSKGALDKLPKADLLLITDIHQDHFDKEGIARVKKDGTVIVAPPAVAADLPGAKALKNGERGTFAGFAVEAIPMYNKVRGPEAGKLFHDKGRGNGYVVSLGDRRIYLSGDTECTEEMKALKDIDVAFVCMNLPYTMPPAEAAECIKAFKPKVVYPYHYRDSNLAELSRALEGEKAVEVRLRTWY